MYEYLVSSYTKHICGLLIWVWEGVKLALHLVSVLRVGWCELDGGSMLLQGMSKLITDKSMVGIYNL